MDTFINYIYENNINVHTWYLYLGGKLELWKFVNTNNKKYVYAGYNILQVNETSFKDKLKLVLRDYDLDFDILLSKIKIDPNSTIPHLLLTYNISDNSNEEVPLYDNYTEPFDGTVFIGGRIKKSVLNDLNKKLETEYNQKMEEHTRIRNCIIKEIKRVNPEKGNSIVLCDLEN